MNVVYTYVPPKNFKILSGYLMILAFGATGFFAFPALFPDMPMRWIFQLSGLACLCLVVFIVSRYILKNTVYSVIEEDGKLDFTVTEITNGGKTRITVCRFSIENIEEIGLFYRGNSSDEAAMSEFVKKAKKKKMPHFNYCPDMRSSPVCCITAKEDTGSFLVKVSPDDTIYNYFMSHKDAQ